MSTGHHWCDLGEDVGDIDAVEQLLIDEVPGTWRRADGRLYLLEHSSQRQQAGRNNGLRGARKRSTARALLLAAIDLGRYQAFFSHNSANI